MLLFPSALAQLLQGRIGHVIRSMI
jgi:hypothetical protein